MAISFVAAGAQIASSSSPQSPALPTGHAAGDLLLVFCIQASAAAVTFTPPGGGGWVSVARNSDATRAMTIEVFGKIDNGSESAPSFAVGAAAAGWAIQMGCWRGVNRATFEDAADVSSSAAAAATFQPTGITTVTDGAWVISFVGSKDDNALNYNNQNGFSDRMSGANYDGTAGNGSDYSVGVADKAIASHGAATCPTWNQSVNGNDQWIALTLALLPANDITATPGVKSLSLSSLAPTVTATANQLVTPDTKALALSRFAPTVLTPRLVTPATAGLTLGTFQPTVLTPVVATPGTRSLSLTPLQPTVLTPRVVTPDTKPLSLTTFAPTVLTPRLVIPGTASLALQVFPPDVDVSTGGSATATPVTASLVLTAFAPNVLTPRTVTPGVASLSLTPFAPSVFTPRVVTPGAAALLLNPFVPSVTVTEPPVVVTPGAAHLVLTTYAPDINPVLPHVELVGVVSTALLLVGQVDAGADLEGNIVAIELVGRVSTALDLEGEVNS